MELLDKLIKRLFTDYHWYGTKSHTCFIELSYINLNFKNILSNLIDKIGLIL